MARNYKISSSLPGVNEGANLLTTVTTTEVPSGTVLFWRAVGQGIDAADLSAGTISGRGIVDRNGRFSISHTIRNDLKTEGSEGLTFELSTDAAFKTIVARGTTTIRDTSTGPTYQASLLPASINEGQAFSASLSTTGLSSKTQLYWRASGTGITASDFTQGSLSGTVSPNIAGQASIPFTLRNDATTEGDEALTVQVSSDSGFKTIVGSFSTNIKDTSITPAVPANVPAALVTQTPSAGAGTLSPTGKTIRTELFKPQFSPFTVEKWKAPLRVPSIMTPLAGTTAVQPGAANIGSLGTPLTGDTIPSQYKDANKYPVDGGSVSRYQDVDPTQKVYGGTSDELWNTTSPEYNDKYWLLEGAPIKFFEQSHKEGSVNVLTTPGNDQLLTDIYGYADLAGSNTGAQFPGPTFRTRVGEPIIVRSSNHLPTYPGMPAPLFQRASVHVHGGHNAAHADGYPSFVLNNAQNGNPDMYRDYYYANTVPKIRDTATGTLKPDFNESPSTMWYHDHGEDMTDLNVIKGLAGFWQIYDKAELDLIKNGTIPGRKDFTTSWDSADLNNQAVNEFIAKGSDYDVPLALSDRRFVKETNAAGQARANFFYDGFPIGSNMDGYLGDVMLVNGQSYPYQEVEKTDYRFRLLGASTGRMWRLHLEDSNGRILQHVRIGNDTWLNEKPLAMSEFTLAMAQRADIVVDFSNLKDVAGNPVTLPADGEVYLVNTAEQTSGRGPVGKLDDLGTTGFKERIMKFVVNKESTKAGTPTTPLTLDTTLRPNTPITPEEVANNPSRTFTFGRGNGMWQINGQGFDSHRSDNPIKIGSAEEWTLKNGGGGWWHPIHIHLESHQLKTIDGVPVSSSYWPEKQWKSDTTLLGPNTEAKLYMKFRTFEGPFVFHCHNLHHEDSMMMYNFDPYAEANLPPEYKNGAYASTPNVKIPHNRDYTPALYPHRAGHTPVPAVVPGGALGGNRSSHKHGHNHTANHLVHGQQNGQPDQISSIQLRSFEANVWGGAKSDQMKAQSIDTYFNGRSGDDTLTGDVGNDMLVGGQGDDRISGGNGHDLIAGEWGSDTLSGGKGQDLFRFVYMDPEHTDVITDFKGGEDKICFNLALVNTNGAGSPGWTYIKNSDFSGKAGEVRFEAGLLQADLNGDGRSDAAAKLLGVTSFSQNWLAPFEVANAH